jgi:hypothetical protein
MALPLAKMAPTAVVICAVGYCCWPYMGGSTATPAEAPNRLPAISAALLSPAIEPAPERDPFGGTSQAQMDDDESEDDEPAKAAAVPAGRQVVQHGTAPRTVPDSAPEASGTAPAGKGPGPTKDKANALSGLALNATYIQGDRRIAVINGRPYAQGESLSISNSTSDPYIVAQIHPYKVLFACQGESAELTYPDSARPPSPDYSGEPVGVSPRTPLDGRFVRRLTPPGSPTRFPEEARAESTADREGDAPHE